jgi:hypothetical protein
VILLAIPPLDECRVDVRGRGARHDRHRIGARKRRSTVVVLLDVIVGGEELDLVAARRSSSVFPAGIGDRAGHEIVAGVVRGDEY